MSQLVRNLDAEIEERSLLKHCFYKMWSDGKLTRDHLAGYSMEYFQLVRAVPEMVSSTGRFVKDATSRKAISEVEREETEHVELWAKFAAALGVSRATLMAYGGTPKTSRAVAGLKSLAGQSFSQGAAAMYSIESEQPRISRTKLDGLVAFYGMSGKEDGTVYFREHETADVRHAALWRGLIQRDVSSREEAVALEASTRSLVAQNTILDSVMETYVSPVTA